MADRIATRVYLRPLLPTELQGKVDPEKVLKSLQRDLLRRLRAKLTQTTYSDRAKKALARSMTVNVMQSSLQVVTNHPAFFPLLEGQKKEQMSWLTKARAPIPIVTDTGELIFRSATAKSMANGKWIHPGRKPSDYVSKAKEESRDFIKTKLMAEIRRQLVNSVKRGGR